MEFTVGDWMNDLIVYIGPNKTVQEALALMRRRYINSLIVNKTEENDYGIITSTDISDKIIAHHQNPSLLKIREVMTSPVITVNQTMMLDECARIMKEHRIHHLPVVDDTGKVIGMISATDFMVAAETIGHQPGVRFE